MRGAWVPVLVPFMEYFAVPMLGILGLFEVVQWGRRKRFAAELKAAAKKRGL